MTCFKSSSRPGFLWEHDLFRKPVSTFRDHALPSARSGGSPLRHLNFPGAIIVLAAEVGHRQRSPQIAGMIAVPDLRPLRLIVVPRLRIEIAELLVLHLVELNVELDDLVIVVAMID